MNGTAYVFLFVLHVVGFTAAFGPAIIYALVLRKATASGGAEGANLSDLAAYINKKVALHALLFTIIVGFGLIGLSDGAYRFSDTWVSASMSIALALAILSYFVLTPALERLSAALRAGGDNSAKVKAAVTAVRIANTVYLLGFVVIVWLMIKKP